MQLLWEKIQSTLDKKTVNDLKKGATDIDLALIESIVGHTLPNDFKDFLKIYNGQKGEVSGIFTDRYFLSTDEIAANWKIWKDLEDSGTFDDCTTENDSQIKNNWWHEGWIPFTDDGSGNHLCIDLAPTSHGNVGQIIEMWHDDNQRKYIAKNFTEFLHLEFNLT